MIEELPQSVAVLEIVDQVAQGDPCASEETGAPPRIPGSLWTIISRRSLSTGELEKSVGGELQGLTLSPSDKRSTKECKAHKGCASEPPQQSLMLACVERSILMRSLVASWVGWNEVRERWITLLANTIHSDRKGHQ